MKKLLLVLFISGLSGIAFMLFIMKPQMTYNQDLELEYGTSTHLVDIFWNEDESSYQDIVVSQEGYVIETVDTDKVGRFNVSISATKGLNTLVEEVAYQVVDSKYPNLEGIDDIVLNYGVSPDFSSIKASDIVDGSLEVDIQGEYNIEQSGEYDLNVSATDKNGNTTTESFKLTIKEKPIEIKKPVLTPPQKEVENKPTPPPTVKPNPPVNNEIKGATYVQGHIFVNKKYGLPSDYAPGENATARKSLNNMINTMIDLGLYIHPTSVSGYRSYATQTRLYNQYVDRDGVDKADTYSARPGHSDHQTGLTFDLKHPNGQLMGKKEPVKYAKEIEWVANNAHTYGFVVRYPKGKESITGYQYEPWHLRYLGDDATKVYQSGLTMEEYFNMPGGGYNSNKPPNICSGGFDLNPYLAL